MYALRLGMLWVAAAVLLAACGPKVGRGDAPAPEAEDTKRVQDPRRAEEEPGKQQAAIATPQSGSVWQDPRTGMDFIFVPGDSYEQGCGSWAGDCFHNATPVRKVTLSPFWIGKTEVTQGQWKKVMSANPSHFQNGDDYPVEQVNWDHVQEFIKRLNAQTDGKYRLPTEAEWEYACRGGGKPVKFGTKTGELKGGMANVNSTDGTVRVGSFGANPLGLHDMTGNVWEWVQDFFNDKAYQSGSVTDPVNVDVRFGTLRVFRGGGWYVLGNARCFDRDGTYRGYKESEIGFRLARTP